MCISVDAGRFFVQRNNQLVVWSFNNDIQKIDLMGKKFIVSRMLGLARLNCKRKVSSGILA